MRIVTTIRTACLALALSLAAAPALADSASVAETPIASAVASTDDSALIKRVADLEAYINNVAPAHLTGVPGPGHNGFMMVCAALVLFMTLPGLFLFYGGLVRSKNILSIIAQCFGIAGLVALLWWSVGYSLTFEGGNALIGSLDKAFLKGVGSAPNTDYSAWVSESVFAMYQMMFAIITPALIIGAVAERMKFKAILLFVFLWMLGVYFPLAHMIWGGTGLMNGVWNPAAAIKSIDFAGGTVVHMSSGWSALVLMLILGKRKGFGQQNFAPHSLVLTAIGTGMLWVGWYGFNAGSAVSADGIASQAFMTTTLSTAVAAFVWPMMEWIKTGKPTVLGFCSGAVAGLVVVTPATGFVTATGAVIIGILAGIVAFLACTSMKHFFKYDDALDTFGVHGVGGTLGALLTGFLASHEANPNLAVNLKDIVGHTLWIEQIKAMALTITLSVVATVIIAYIVKALVGLRPEEEEEVLGLDLVDHGEQGYHFQE
jgi:ammonium transporter, Amt family